MLKSVGQFVVTFRAYTQNQPQNLNHGRVRKAKRSKKYGKLNGLPKRSCDKRYGTKPYSI